MLFKRYQTASFSTDIIYSPAVFQNIYGPRAKNVKLKHIDSTSGQRLNKTSI